jgi:hypothetical protein
VFGKLELDNAIKPEEREALNKLHTAIINPEES